MRAGSQTIDAAPPSSLGSGGGSGDGSGGGGWAWLLTARGIFEAELVRGVLESAGIVPVALDATDPTPGAWMFLSGNVNALVRVLVPASLLDAARLTLLEAGLDAPAPASMPPGPATAPRRGARWIVWAVLTSLVVAAFLIATLRASVT